jgi:hypothetical protein
MNWVGLLITSCAIGGVSTSVQLDGRIVDVEPFDDGAIAVVSTSDGISLLLFDSLGNQTPLSTDIDGGCYPSFLAPDILLLLRPELGTAAVVEVMKLQPSLNLLRTSWFWTHEQALTDSEGQWSFVIQSNDNGCLVTAGDSWSMVVNNWIASLDEDGNQEWLLEGIEGFQGPLSNWGGRIALDCGSAVRILNDSGQEVRIDSFPSMAVRTLSSVGDALLVVLQDTSGYVNFALLNDIASEYNIIETGDKVAAFAYWTDRPEMYCIPSGERTFIVADNLVDRNIPYTVYIITGDSLSTRVSADSHFDFDVRQCYVTSEGLCVLGLSQSRDMPDNAAIDLLDTEGQLDSCIQLSGTEILDAQQSGTDIIIGTTNSSYLWLYSIDGQGRISDFQMSLRQSNYELRSLFLSAFPLYLAVFSPAGRAQWSSEGSVLYTGIVQ